MMQTWGMQRPIIKGIGERGGSAQELDPNTPLVVLDHIGFTGILATNSVLDFYRPLREEDHLQSEIVMESISNRKKTGLGEGYFVTWVQIFADKNGDEVGRQTFTVLKFNDCDLSTIVACSD